MIKRPPMPDQPADFPMPESVRRFAAQAPNGPAVVGPAEPEPAPVPEAMDLATLRARFPKREAVQQMSLKIPKSLYDDLNWYSRVTGVTMTDMFIAGVQKELAKIKAKLPRGIE